MQLPSWSGARLDLATITSTVPVASADEPAALEEIFLLVRQRHGLDLSLYRRAPILRRFATRMRSLNCHSHGDYLLRLREDPEECRQLVCHVTIKVSRFFRDPQVFQRLRRDILPELFAAKKGGEPLRFWSAGCGNGEEAYSLALLAQEVGERCGQPLGATVYGTDVDEEALDRARRAVYRPEALSELAGDFIATHFAVRKGRTGPEYELLPVWRRGVHFQRQDLLSDEAPGEGRPFDLILCRNVLIYLERSAQERVVSLLRESLAPRGCLCLSEAEQLSAVQSSYFEIIHRRDGLYRLVSAVPRGGRKS
jgi:chemotaxis methyl-accepting protein methylase